MANATDGKKYDFKRNGDPDNNDRNNHHRGSKWGVKADGTQVYASARDAGNYSAGYISGLNSVNWTLSRIGFDGLELSKSLHTEGLQSTLAQELGHNKGYPLGQARATKLYKERVKKNVRNPFHHNGIKN